MSVDFLKLANDALSRTVRESLGIVMGNSAEEAAGGFDAASRTVLNGLKTQAGTAEGVAEIFRVARDQDFGLLDRIGNVLNDSGKVAGLQETGSKMLDSIFGSRLSDSLQQFAKSAGLSETAASGILKLAAPVVMGVVGRVVSKQSLNAPGLASMLVTQPDWPTIAVARKEGEVPVANTSDATSIPAKAERHAASSDQHSTSGSPLFKFVAVFAVVAIVITGIVWYLNQTKQSDSEPGTPPATQETVDSRNALDNPPAINAEQENLGVEKIIERFSAAVVGLKDIDEKNAAKVADKISAFADTIDSIGLERLQGISKSLFSMAAKKFRSELDLVLEKNGKNEIAGLVRPAIQKVKDKLSKYGF